MKWNLTWPETRTVWLFACAAGLIIGMALAHYDLNRERWRKLKIDLYCTSWAQRQQAPMKVEAALRQQCIETSSAVVAGR
jgi:hypothetical protein